MLLVAIDTETAEQRLCRLDRLQIQITLVNAMQREAK